MFASVEGESSTRTGTAAYETSVTAERNQNCSPFCICSADSHSAVHSLLASEYLTNLKWFDRKDRNKLHRSLKAYQTPVGNAESLTIANSPSFVALLWSVYALFVSGRNKKDYVLKRLYFSPPSGGSFRVRPDGRDGADQCQK